MCLTYRDNNHNPEPLTDYQRAAARFLWSKSSAVLAIGMGLGKTRTVLEFLNYAMQVYPTLTAIIVAPKRVAQSVWRQEAAKWQLWRVARNMELVDGTAAEKKKKADSGAPFLIVSRDNLKYVEGKTVDILIIDEITNFKNFKAARTRQIMNIQASRRIGLTGTFAPNGYIDIYPQLAVLGIAPADNSEYYAWRGRWFEDVYAARPVRYNKFIPRDGVRLDDIIGQWRQNIFCLSSEDYLTLPPIQYINIDFDLSAAEAAAYEDMRAFLHFETLDGFAFSVEEAQKFAKLQTLGSGFVYDADDEGTPSGPRSIEETPTRIIEAIDFIQRARAEGERVLLFYQFRATAIALKKAADAAGISIISLSSPDWLTAWNNHQADALVLQPAAAAHGLNLQHGGHIVLWCELTYNYELYAQANARLYRTGQREPVRVYHLVASPSYDAQILSALKKKDEENKSFEKKYKWKN